MAAGEGLKVVLGTEAFEALRSKMNALVKLHQSGQLPDYTQPQAEYVDKTDPAVIVADDQSRAEIIRELLNKGHSEDVWRQLVEDDPDLASKLASAQLQINRIGAIEEYERLLASEDTAEDDWQQFFKRNTWMLDGIFSAPMAYLGEEVYLGGKLAINRNGAGGVATDYLFKDASSKSFAVVELKTPDAGLVGGSYRRSNKAYGSQHDMSNETYSMHAELTGAVVQARNQIAVAQTSFASTFGVTFEDLNAVHPFGVVVAGLYSELSASKQKSLDHFRNSLHGVRVVTFDELLLRLKWQFDDPPAAQPQDAATDNWYDDF